MYCEDLDLCAAAAAGRLGSRDRAGRARRARLRLRQGRAQVVPARAQPLVDDPAPTTRAPLLAAAGARAAGARSSRCWRRRPRRLAGAEAAGAGGRAPGVAGDPGAAARASRPTRRIGAPRLRAAPDRGPRQPLPRPARSPRSPRWPGGQRAYWAGGAAAAGALVDREQVAAGSAARSGARSRERAAARPRFAAPLRIAPQRAHRARQRARRPQRHAALVPDQLGHAAAARGDDRHAGAHRLEHREGRELVAARAEHQRRGAAQQRRHLRRAARGPSSSTGAPSCRPAARARPRRTARRRRSRAARAPRRRLDRQVEALLGREPRRRPARSAPGGRASRRPAPRRAGSGSAPRAGRRARRAAPAARPPSGWARRSGPSTRAPAAGAAPGRPRRRRPRAREPRQLSTSPGMRVAPVAAKAGRAVARGDPDRAEQPRVVEVEHHAGAGRARRRQPARPDQRLHVVGVDDVGAQLAHRRRDLLLGAPRRAAAPRPRAGAARPPSAARAGDARPRRSPARAAAARRSAPRRPRSGSGCGAAGREAGPVRSWGRATLSTPMDPPVVSVVVPTRGRGGVPRGDARLAARAARRDRRTRSSSSTTARRRDRDVPARRRALRPPTPQRRGLNAARNARHARGARRR